MRTWKLCINIFATVCFLLLFFCIYSIYIFVLGLFIFILLFIQNIPVARTSANHDTTCGLKPVDFGEHNALRWDKNTLPGAALFEEFEEFSNIPRMIWRCIHSDPLTKILDFDPILNTFVGLFWRSSPDAHRINDQNLRTTVQLYS